MKTIKVYSGKIIWIALIFIGLIMSCKKNYITGGTIQDVNKYKDVTTFDYLKSVQQFDTLTQVIAAANLQDKINQTGTYFAVSNTVIYNYLNARTLLLQNTVDANAKFTLDSLKYYVKNNINGTRDSLLMYFIPGEKLMPNDLTSLGKIYPSGLANNNVAVSYVYTKDPNLGYTTLVSSVPQILVLTQLWKPYAIDNNNPAFNAPSDVGINTFVESSFITTKTGVVNVLRPGNALFYYGSR